jgi:hypothetical protein
LSILILSDPGASQEAMLQTIVSQRSLRAAYMEVKRDCEDAPALFALLAQYFTDAVRDAEGTPLLKRLISSTLLIWQASVMDTQDPGARVTELVGVLHTEVAALPAYRIEASGDAWWPGCSQSYAAWFHGLGDNAKPEIAAVTQRVGLFSASLIVQQKLTLGAWMALHGAEAV